MSTLPVGLLGKRVKAIRELAQAPELGDAMRANVTELCNAIERGRLGPIAAMELFVTLHARIGSEQKLEALVAKMQEEADG